MKNSSRRKHLLTPFICVICSGLFAADAGAQYLVQGSSKQGTYTQEVGYSDLDLTHDDGVDILNTRLSDAARNVCGPKKNYGAGSTIRSRQVTRDIESCISEAMNKAVASINNPKLSVLHAR